MQLNWNLLGFSIWVLIFLFLIFTMQNIRRRHLRMIIKQRQRFSWKQFLLDVLEVLILVGAVGFMIFMAFFNSPNLSDRQEITSHISYTPLVLNTDTKSPHYVEVTSTKGKNPVITFKVMTEGRRLQVTDQDATVAYGTSPLSVTASAYPFDKTALTKQDAKYQKAYIAKYQATYKNTWQNGIGFNVGHTAESFYLIRVPDQTFIKEIEVKK